MRIGNSRDAGGRGGVFYHFWGRFFRLGLFFLAGFLSGPPAGAESVSADSFTIDLLGFPLYARRGFHPDYVDTVPDSESWLLLPASPGRLRPARVCELGLPGLPQRRFFSPRGAAEEDFTFIIPFRHGDIPPEGDFVPALYLAGLGDNWEIWLNGTSIAREMYTDASGRIKIHRALRHVTIPFGRELLLPGRNILTLRLRGDPTYRDLGFFYGDGYYIGSLSRILRNTDETFSAALIGIYFFMGLYHLAIGAAMKKDRYNLYYGLFSLCLGFYFFTRSHSIYLLVADQNLVTRLEFLSLYLALPLGGAFLEELAFRRVSRITRIYGAFFGLLGLSQLFFSLPYALDTLVVWQYCALAALAIILVYDLGYALLVTGRDLRSQFHDRGRELSARETVFRVILRTPLGNIGIGVVISIAASIIDVVNSLLFSRGVGLSSYVFLIVTVGAALILARRVGALYSQQQRIIVRANKGMNARLVDCIIVQDHDPSELASLNTKETVMFTDIRNFTRITGNMGSQTTTDFLSALNEVMAKPIFAFQDKGFVAYTDKFIGDGTMNVFSDPAIALESAVEMRKQLSLFNKNPDRYFSGAPPGFRVDVGTGLAHGPMTVGVMGHSRRVDYTHIGGTVNLASRLETLTKAYRVSILLNGGVYQAVDTRRFNLRLVDRIRAKGMSEPVEIYEEFSSNSPAIRDIKQELLPQFRELQEMYFSGRDWPDALALADEITRRVDDTVIRNGLGSDSPGDPLPQFYAKRMRTVLKTPELLAQWDGVYTFDGE